MSNYTKTITKATAADDALTADTITGGFC